MVTLLVNFASLGRTDGRNNNGDGDNNDSVSAGLLSVT